MSGCPTTHLTLPQWDGGSRKIRFIYLVNLTSFRLTKCPNQGPVIPLYLGADLLSNTDIRTENHPRCHAKFAKKGLATKINLSSAFRFQGLKVPAASNSLWFYSIQGLFRVAFEMYSKQEQLVVLENLQDIWKSQINDSPLKMNYNLSVQLDVMVSTSISFTQSKSETSQPHSCQVVGELMDVCSSDKADTSADHDYCSFPKRSLQTEESEPIVFTLREKLHSLDDQLSSQPHRCTARLETILLILENIDRYMNDNLEEKDAAETVLALLMAKDWAKDSVYSSYLLTCMGRWLGQQFHAANSTISQKVECFKVQHIEQISDLPPAEELATELFPEAMQTLLLHWMGLCEESTLDKRHSEYPILLLILEFANHNLITGVAHVLYSSLICK
ncbi:uncharacterized protein si:ch211-110p13.9 [Melanotaenia boesemani]|uniref:uncharacterized protein si:ch211-110p13.9 n=1 Tax=Melanotaenia boesemani TaxID=1250792 RepID=UPI001C03B9F5|nr:uncharacterized protein si:ch211-110p13.9 [Melanotaenia boesemani]XP_041856009.1 uncharacterized protein si:ch211-110p13.9 [Melanotaenia boesemani]XP_041856010.1 uncharacterized protein si:ch211-110p13.9 [Melanotaenia boesemani]